MTPTRRLWLRRLYLAAVALVFGWLVVARRDSIADLLAETKPAWLVAALVASVLTLVPQALFWERALKSFGETVTFGRALSATARALLTRYAPGGVWFAAGRAAILGRRGIGLPALAATGTVELAMSAAVALALGTALLGASASVPAWSRWAGPALLVVLFLAVPWLNRGMAWVAHRRSTDLPAPLTRATLGGLIGVNALYWLVIASVFWLYLSAFGLAPDPAKTGGGFMVAWGIGFLSPFAPQGLGVFEVILASLLGGDLADMIAVVAGFRALMLVRDVGVWAVAETLERRR